VEKLAGIIGGRVYYWDKESEGPLRGELFGGKINHLKRFRGVSVKLGESALWVGGVYLCPEDEDGTVPQGTKNLPFRKKKIHLGKCIPGSSSVLLGGHGLFNGNSGQHTPRQKRGITCKEGADSGGELWGSVCGENSRGTYLGGPMLEKKREMNAYCQVRGGGGSHPRGGTGKILMLPKTSFLRGYGTRG